MAENEIPVNIRVHGKEEAQASLRDLGTTIGEVFAVAELIKFTKEGLSNFSKLDTASRELAASLHHQSDALVKLGIDSAKTSTMRAPEIIQGEKVLATYKMTEAQIKQMMPALLNLATRTGSISSAARLMGMSFENGSKRLGMFGINVHGTLGSQERLNSIIQQTTAALGDQNAAAYAAMNPLDKIKKSFEEISVSLGKAAAPEFEKMAKFFNDNQETFEKFAKFIGDHIDIIGLGVVSLAMMKAVPVIVSQITTVSKAAMANPFVALATGLGLLTNALIDFWSAQSDKKVSGAMKDSEESVKAIYENTKAQIPILQQAVDAQKGLAILSVDGLHFENLTADAAERRLKAAKAYVNAQDELAKKKKKVEPPPLVDEKQAELERELVVKQEQEKIDTIVKIKKEGEQLNMAEGRKQIDEEEREYKINLRNMLGGQKEMQYATELHERKLASIYKKFGDEERKNQLERMKVGNEKVKSEQEKADKTLASIINKQAEKSDKEKHKIFTKSIFDQKKELKKMHEYFLISDEQYISAKKALDREAADYEIKLNLMRTSSALDFAKVSMDSMTSIANASKANAQVKKRLAEGEAIISGGKAALGVIENSGQFISSFGPIAGPILMGVELAGIIAEAVYQVQQIESAKMAYGGIARGGTPGVDSIPAMLMPGEVVYNPAHPNPALASMIGGGMSNSNNQQTTHIHMAPIVVNGNVSKSTAAEIGRVTQKALISALKEAQVNGNVTASGLVVRH